MKIIWLFIQGLVALLLLGAWCGYRIRREYRTRRELSLATVAAVWLLYALHFSLILIAAIRSTWWLPLPRTLALGGGILFLASGTILYAAAVISFRSLKRMSGRDMSRLITGGAYRWSRNPQNMGWFLFLLGLALLRRSGMVLLLALLFWVSFRLYLPLEEELLERVFGETYREYRSRTHRYLGPPGRP